MRDLIIVPTTVLGKHSVFAILDLLIPCRPGDQVPVKPRRSKSKSAESVKRKVFSILHRTFSACPKLIPVLVSSN